MKCIVYILSNINMHTLPKFYSYVFIFYMKPMEPWKWHVLWIFKMERGWLRCNRNLPECFTNSLSLMVFAFGMFDVLHVKPLPFLGKLQLPEQTISWIQSQRKQFLLKLLFIWNLKLTNVYVAIKFTELQSTPVISRLLGAKIRERELSGSPVISRYRAKATTREIRITDPDPLAFTTLKQYVER